MDREDEDQRQEPKWDVDVSSRAGFAADCICVWELCGFALFALGFAAIASVGSLYMLPASGH